MCPQFCFCFFITPIFISFIMYNSGEGIHLFPDKHLLRCVWIIQCALPFLCVWIDPHFVCLTRLIICVCSSVGHYSPFPNSLPCSLTLFLIHFFCTNISLQPFPFSGFFFLAFLFVSLSVSTHGLFLSHSLTSASFLRLSSFTAILLPLSKHFNIQPRVLSSSACTATTWDF